MANYTGYCNTAAHEEEKTVTLWETIAAAGFADGDTIQSIAFNSGNICIPCYLTIYDNGGKQLGRFIVSNAVKLPVVGSMAYLYQQASGIEMTSYSFNANYIPTTPGSIWISPLTPVPNEPLAISWTPSYSDKLEGYDLERSINGQAWTVIMHELKESFSDTVGTEWVTVAYRVAAYDTTAAYSTYRATAAHIVGTPPIPMNVEDDYLNLITSEHIQRPRFMALVEAMLKPLEGISILFSEWDKAFDIELAVGKQLDVVGAVVGMNRQLPYISKYGSSILSDDDYRFLIKAKSIINRWDGSREMMMKTWSETFPRTLLLIDDHQDMSADLLISGMRTTDYIEEMIENDLLLPRGEGVRYNYSIIEDKSFSYDYDDPMPPSPDHLYGGYDQWAIWEGTIGPAPAPPVPDDSGMIFVDGYNGTGGSGTETDPFHNWDDAVAQWSATRNVIYIMNEIVVTATTPTNKVLNINPSFAGAVIKRSSRYSGPLITLNNQVTSSGTYFHEIKNVTIDGNKDAFYPYIVCQSLIQTSTSTIDTCEVEDVTFQNNYAMYGAAIYLRSNSMSSGSVYPGAILRGVNFLNNRAEYGIVRVESKCRLALYNTLFDGNTGPTHIQYIGSRFDCMISDKMVFQNYSPMSSVSLSLEDIDLYIWNLDPTSTIPRVLFRDGVASLVLNAPYNASGITVLECSTPVDGRVLVTGSASHTLDSIDFVKFKYTNTLYNLSLNTSGDGSINMNLVP
jgi:hypothetical protein